MEENPLQEKLERGDPSLVHELHLDKYRVNKINWPILCSFTHLEVLSLNGIGLTTLENIPNLPTLKKLELCNNQISGGLQFLADAKLTNLVSLNLSGNKINRISELEPLANLVKLEELNLNGCAVTKTPDYKLTVYTLIPSLRILDRSDRSSFMNNEDEDTEEDEIEHKNIPKTKPPPQHGKLFNNNINGETFHYETDLKLCGDSYNNPISLDLDNVVSNLQQIDCTLNGASTPPLASIPSTLSTPEQTPLSEPNETNLTKSVLQLLQEPIEDGDSSEDEDFDPGKDGEEDPYSESEVESESESSEEGEELNKILKRSQDDIEHQPKRRKQ